MNNALKTAIKYAKLGYFVFPIQPNSKYPYKGFKWRDKSTDDPQLIERAGLSEKYLGCNWAIDCTKSKIAILDADTYKEDFKSVPEPIPQTFKVRTARGGDQYYFNDPDTLCKSTSNKIAPAVDTRGSGGYALIPGSVFNNKEYKIARSAPLADLPEWIIDKLGKSKPKKENHEAPLTELDQEHNINAAVKYLTDRAPEAVEGSGGDQATYEVACRVRDLGISEDLATTLMLDHWNDSKAFPPWDPDDLEKKVNNAFTYAKDRPGNATPEAIFPDIFKSTKLFTTAKDLRANRKPPEFIVKKYIETETTNLWFGDPGSFKSFLTIDLAVAIAAGQQWAGEDTKQGAVFYLAGEGHGGMARRIEACCRQRRIHEDTHFPLFVSNTAIPLSNNEIVDKLQEAINKAQDQPIRLIVIDTLAANFGVGDENSTKDMSGFINLINMKLRKPLNCAVLINHHSGHGDKHRARGSSALDAGLDSYSKIYRDEMMVCVRQPGKMKDAEPFDDVWFDADVLKIDVDEDMNPVTSLTVNFNADYVEKSEVKGLGENQSFIFNTVSENEDISLSELKKKFKAFKEGLGKGYDRRNFKRTFDAMVEGNIIEQVGVKVVLAGLGEVKSG